MKHNMIFFTTMIMCALAQHSAWAIITDGLEANFGLSAGTNQQNVLNRTGPDLEVDLVQDGPIAFAVRGLENVAAAVQTEIENELRSQLIDFGLAIAIDQPGGGEPQQSLQALLTVAIANNDLAQGIAEAFLSRHTEFTLAYAGGLRDPALVYSYEIVNPTDQTMTVILEGSQEILTLNGQGDVQFELNIEAIDNNANGANVSASGFLFGIDDSQANTIIPIGNGGFGAFQVSADESTPGNISELLLDTTLVFPGQTFGQGLTMTVEISPGDTALIEGFFAIGDDNTPLPDVAFLNAFVDTLGEANSFASNLLAVPEPNSAVLLVVCGLSALVRRPRQDG